MKKLKTGHNNPPYAVLEMDKETAQFIIKNCIANEQFAFNTIISMGYEKANTESGKKLINSLEKAKKQFRKLRLKIEALMPPEDLEEIK
jgi:hypothetical protein